MVRTPRARDEQWPSLDAEAMARLCAVPLAARVEALERLIFDLRVWWLLSLQVGDPIEEVGRHAGTGMAIEAERAHYRLLHPDSPSPEAVPIVQVVGDR
jgi:hypothetical protein